MDLQKELTTFLATAQNPLIVVLGPTASGKTALSLKIAQLINGEIISTDSRQIYRQMDIGTDSLSPQEQEGIPHHLLGIAEPDHTLTLAEYHDLAQEKIAEIREREDIPMLVGGTGLYISSIIDAYEMPRIPPDSGLRQELEEKVKQHGKESIHEDLKKLDPEAAARIHANNTRYVIRAIEVAKASKKGKPAGKTAVAFDVFMVGISWPREKLYERVELRVNKQIERGLVQEVKELLAKGYDENLPSMSSLGVKEIIPYLKGEMSLKECIDILKRNTRRYAKRQMTWFRRYDNIHWLTPGELTNFLTT